MMEIFSKRFESFYDKYIHFYNGEESKLTAFSELTTIQVALNRINDKYISQIGRDVDIMIESLLIDMMHVANGKPKKFEPNEYSRAAKEIDTTELKNNIMSLVCNPYTSSDWEIVRNAVKERLINEEFKFSKLRKPDQDLTNVLHKRDKLLNIIPNLRAIKFVVEKIAVDGYPESMVSFRSLPIEERRELSGVVLKNKEKKKERMEIHWPKIVKEVHKVIDGNLLSDFVTKGKNAKSSLYTPVYRRYSEIPKHTLIKWLNDGIKEGNLERDLKKIDQSQTKD